MRTQATAAGESASLNTVDLSQVIGISYMPHILSSNRWQLESDRDREAFASLLTDVPFTRLTDGDTPADDPAVSERVQPIVEKGLLFSYTVRDRKTEGTVYIAPDGQACWFTSDGADVYLAEPGSVAYAEAQSLGFRLMYGGRHRDGDGTVSRPDIGGTEQGIMTVRPIAHIRTDFPEKFGIPRQSGRVPDLEARIVFEPPYRNPDALRGLEGFSHLWLLWQFSAALRGDGEWQPMVRPPRLGGNTPMGVFATRSPFRPNPIGLSSVRLCRIDYDGADAPTLTVAGADLMDGTPLYDIKPYLAYTDSHPEATGGFAQNALDHRLRVHCPPALLDCLPERKRASLLAVLAEDPRPSYQHDPERLYGLFFAGFNVEFTVDGDDLYVLGMQAR